MNVVKIAPDRHATVDGEAVSHAQLPLLHPDRQRPRFNIPKAWHHLREFRKDIEKTSEIFHMFDCLPWVGVIDTACRFLSSEEGRRIYLSEPFLPGILDDHDALRAMGRESLGYQYADYMETEGLSAAGLVAEYEDFRGDRPRLDDQVEWYIDRLRDTHDLQHFLTGFNRDALGEHCIGAWVFQQRPSYGHLTLGYGGVAMLKLNMKSRAPVWRAVREARKLGKACPRIFEQPIRALLPLPTDEVRRRLNIRPPHYYHEAHRIWRSEGTDPYKVLAKPAAA